MANEYDVICRNASVLAFHLWPTIFVDISGSKIFATAFHHVPPPLHPCGPSRKIYEFFISSACAKAEALHLVNLATKREHCRWKWQQLAVFRSSAEGKKIKHLSKKLGGHQHRTAPAGQILGGRDPCNLCGVDAYAVVLNWVCRLTQPEAEWLSTSFTQYKPLPMQLVCTAVWQPMTKCCAAFL